MDGTAGGQTEAPEEGGIMPKPAWERRMDAFEARMQAMWEATQKEQIASEKLHRERMERIDRRLDATTKILQTGARLLLRVEESQRKLVENLVNPRNGAGKKKN